MSSFIKSFTFKKYLRKYTILSSILLLSLSGIIVYASFPTAFPSGISNNDLLITKINNFFDSSCSTSSGVIIGFNSDGTVNCGNSNPNISGITAASGTISLPAISPGGNKDGSLMGAMRKFLSSSCPSGEYIVGTKSDGSKACSVSSPSSVGNLAIPNQGINFPSNGPSGEGSGGTIGDKIINFFNSICPAGQYLAGVGGGGEKRCDYYYNWIDAGTWGACNKSCGGGVQYKDYKCQRNDGNIVDDSYCANSKPITTQSCNPQACISDKILYKYLMYGGWTTYNTPPGAWDVVQIGFKIINGRVELVSSCGRGAAGIGSCIASWSRTNYEYSGNLVTYDGTTTTATVYYGGSMGCNSGYQIGNACCIQWGEYGCEQTGPLENVGGIPFTASADKSEFLTSDPNNYPCYNVYSAWGVYTGTQHCTIVP